jgi:hypothetical protein
VRAASCRQRDARNVRADRYEAVLQGRVMDLRIRAHSLQVVEILNSVAKLTRGAEMYGRVLDLARSQALALCVAGQRLQRSQLRRRSCGVELASQPGLSRVLHSLLQCAALRREDPTHRKAALVQQIGQGGVLGGILLDGLRIKIDNPQRKGE